MRGRVIAVVTLAVMLAGVSIDLTACGDKFTRVGRSPRLKGYAAIQRASVLVYLPRTPDAKGIQQFEALLKRAGHAPVFVKHGTNVAQVVAGGAFDLIIADYADAASIRQQIARVPARPDILPILHKPSKALAAQASNEYLHYITFDNKYDLLEELDHAMELRLNASAFLAHE